MKVNLYYAPYPCQIFADGSNPINTERPLNPKSALVTLATGLRTYSKSMRFSCEIEIIDLMLGGQRTYYKTIPYGPKQLDCYQHGTPFELAEHKFREPGIHGITSNHTNASQIVTDLAQHIKRVNPKAIVVVGGTDATARPRYYLSRGVDIVVQGEGEYVFSRIVQAVEKGLDMGTIPSICTHDAPEGTGVELDKFEDLDEIDPMSLDLIPDLSLYTDTAEGPPPPGVQNNFICWETSRGCAWRCSFCTAPMRGKYRFMSPQAVQKHFDYFRSKGIRTIVWQEDNPLSRVQQSNSGRYLYDKGRDEVIQIFRLAREYGFAWEFANGLEFGKFLRDGQFDHDLMDALLWSDQSGDSWTGCYRVQIPLDNLDLEDRKRFPKLHRFEGQLEILAEMLTSYNVIHQTYDLFIGYPEHDAAVLDRIMKGCMRIKEELTRLNSAFVPYYNVFNLALLPGTQDFKRYKHLLQFDIEQHPEVIGIFLSATNTEHFTYYETYRRRVAMCNQLNAQDMISRYDGIHTGD